MTVVFDRDDIYQTVFERDVIDRLARIEVTSGAAAKAHEDHEVRLRHLEQRMWTVGGAAAVVGAVLTKLSLSLHFPWGT